MSTPNCSIGLPHPARLTISVSLGSEHSHLPVEVRTPTVPSSHMVGFVRACSSCQKSAELKEAVVEQGVFGIHELRSHREEVAISKTI